MPLSFLPQQPRIRWRLMAAIFCIGLIALISLTEIWYARRWNDRIVPGVHVGVVALGGKTEEEARVLLEETIDTLMRTGLPFAYQSKRITITPILSAREDPDLTYPLIEWDIDAMLTSAKAVGHSGPWWRRWTAQTKAFFIGTTISGVFTIEKEKIKEALQENTVSLENPAVEAQLIVNDGTMSVTEEALGKIFDYDAAITFLDTALLDLSAQPIPLTIVTDYPAVKKEMIEQFRPMIEQLLARGTIQLLHGTRWWRIHPNEWGSWLTVTVDNATPGLTLDVKKVAASLAPIAQEIDVPSRDAKFVVRDGRVVEFQSAFKGKKLSPEKTTQKILEQFIRDTGTSIAIVVDVLEPNVDNEATNTFGIVELIGVGKSNFKGSPVNRRHNIAVGARALHGLLIAPNEEFSLLKALGDIDGANGYKPELVIKGNRTIPEFGGGLCQIGTTTFRAALGSGLPITERQNHSYSVPYYLENGKPGVDATIYGPKPDFKFVNDTDSYILIQTFIKGDDITFEFWGKKDGRVATRSEPKVTGIRKPPPTKIIETEDLPPGKKKCTERAHTGATAEFTYTVLMPNGEKREKVFRSVYRPWQEVCLVGKAKVEATSAETTPEALPSADAEGMKEE